MAEAINVNIKTYTMSGELELVPVQIENGRIQRDQEEASAVADMLAAFRDFDAISLAGMACCAMQ